MTIDKTPWRRTAAWLATGIGLVLVLAWAPGDAQATSPDRELRTMLQHGAPGAKVISPTRAHWPRQGVTVVLKATKRDAAVCHFARVCLWEHANEEGRMIYFTKPGTFKLSAWSMGADPAHDKGVSSYHNLRSKASYLIGPNFRLRLRGGRNVPRAYNDRSNYVRLY